MEMNMKERAAKALDLTHSVDGRGPRTHMARTFVANWLDGGFWPKESVKRDIIWLEGIIKYEGLDDFKIS
jgi:hypothetical protein